jgi:hypothetical protein
MVPDNDDAEVSSLTISLLDPFLADRIWDIPVRGTDCRHTECFDLEIFLSQCKPREEPGYPSMPDCWRCPICRGDARPQKLMIDGFLSHIRGELAHRSLLSSKSIKVWSNGSRFPRPDEKALSIEVRVSNENR